MKVKVVNRENLSIQVTYEKVDAVVDVFDTNGNLCHQIQMGEETATFPACEWKFYTRDWREMF